MNSVFRSLFSRPARPWLHCLLPFVLLLPAASPAVAENQSLKLDGRGSYVELPPDAFKALTQATVEVWVKWDSLSRYARVFEFGANWQSMSVFNEATGPNLRYNIYLRNAKQNPSARFMITATNLIRTNEWMHLALVSGPGGMLLYANGRLVGQNTNTASFANISGRLAGAAAGRDAQGAAEGTGVSTQEQSLAQIRENMVKRLPSRDDTTTRLTNYLGRGLAGVATDRDFQGELDEVRVWNHRRTLAQIRDNMFKRLSGGEEGLVHLWNFDDGTANDACSGAAHGKLMGRARVASCDLGLVAEAAAVAPPTAQSSPASAASAGASGSAAAGWWIAVALAALVLLVAWLIVLLRRSGVGSGKLVSDGADRALLPAGSAGAGTLSLSDQAELKERALAELTDFAKQSLVQGLHSQRAALIEAQKQAQQELAELEVRLMSLRLPERIQAYERRIAELERELETRGEEFRELTQATLRALRQKLESEKTTERATRFN